MDTVDKRERRNISTGQIIIFTLSILKLFLPSIQIKFSGKEELMDLFGTVFDQRLIPWVFVINILGYWLKKTKIPKWAPPMPLILFLASFTVCAFFGWAHAEVEGFRAVVITIVEYGIINGGYIAVLAVFGYDTVHSFTKKLKGGTR